MGDQAIRRKGLSRGMQLYEIMPTGGTPGHFGLAHKQQHPNSKNVARRFEVLHRRNCIRGVPRAPDSQLRMFDALL
jgi:hypothetical protein